MNTPPEIINLGFGELHILGGGLVEIIADEGVSIERHHVTRLHNEFGARFPEGVYVLANKKNQYSYAFETQQLLFNPSMMKALAILVYTELSSKSMEMLLNLPKNKKWKSKIFTDREEALGWLQGQMVETQAQPAHQE